MAEQVKFVNVKINVNGQVHNVKVEQGVSFGKDFGSVWTADSNGIKAIEKKNNGSDSSTVTYSMSRNNEISMTDAEWALFKNVADNDNDAGTLTKDDIKKAENLYSANKFTDDISKGLPKGYKAYRGSQKLLKDGVSAYVDNDNVAEEITNENFEMKFANVSFSRSQDSYTKQIEKWISESADGKVDIISYGEGQEAVAIKGSDGIKRTYIVYYDNEERELIEKEYTDNNGAVITEDLMNKITTIVTTVNGKKVTEKYGDNYSSIEVEYYENGKHIVEERDIHKSLKSKEVKYTQDNKEYTERYNSSNQLVKREYHTKEKNDYVIEDYEDNKLIKRTADKCETYYKDGKAVRTVENVVNKGYIVTENGVKSKYNARGYLTKVGNFDVEKYAESELSAKANEYAEAFKGASADEIAQIIKDQIDGPSFNNKTFAMIDAIPSCLISDVMSAYSKKSSFWGGPEPLFVGLYEEWGVSKEDIMQRLKEKCAQHLRTRDDDFLRPVDYALVKKLNEGCPAGQSFEDYIRDVEKLFVK